MTEKTIGTNDAAYFIGRKGVLNWLNSFLQLDYTKVEDACSGVVHCQIMDCLFPGQVPLHKVNFNAKRDYEFIPNYKILQDVFNKLNIDKVIPVNKLIQGRYQDNLEFLQWMKRFFELNYQGQEYDPVARRKQAMNSTFNRQRLNINPNMLSQFAPKPKKTSQQKAHRMSNLSLGESSVHTSAPSEINGFSSQKRSPEQSINGSNTMPADEYQKLLLKFRKLHKQSNKMKLTLESVAQERNFYFDKLMKIESIIQKADNVVDIEPIKEILYATSDNVDEDEIVDETEMLKGPEPMNLDDNLEGE